MFDHPIFPERNLMIERGAPDPSAPPSVGSHDALTAALIRTARSDAHAFHYVYRMTSAKLMGVCRRYVSDRQTAEDILHEVYIVVWTRAGYFDPKRGSAIAWLSRIARNRAIDWSRSNAGRILVAIDGEINRQTNGEPEAIDQMILTARTMALSSLVEDLEARRQNAIRAVFFEGLTHAELARRHNVALGTAKSWGARGLVSRKHAVLARSELI